MAIQGLRDSEDFTVTGQRPENWRAGMLMLDPNGMTPLTGLTSAMKKRVVDDPLFHWFEKSMETRRVALHATNGDLTLINTTLILDANGGAHGLKQGDILRVEESSELVRVTADPTSKTSLEVSRSFAGSSAATLDANGAGVNPNLVVVGSAYEEGSLAPTGIAFDPSEINNRTQIFRNTLEATRTAQKTRLRTGEAVREAKREALLYHGVDMERAMWFGTKSLSTVNGKALHTMDGFESFIAAANIVSAPSATADMLYLEERMFNIFKFGSSEKVGFCGNRALLTIGQILRKNATWNFNSGVKEFGMNVTRITSPFGELVLKTHPLFNQMTGGATAGTDYYGVESWLFIMDMANMTYVHLKDSDTQWESDLQDNGLDGLKAGYLSEVSLEVHHPTSHYLIKDLAIAAVDT